MATKRQRLELCLVVLKYTLLGLGALTMIVPFFDMFVGALKSPKELISPVPVLIPKDPNWGIFIETFDVLPMARLYKNSTIVTCAITLSVLFTSSISGFALAKYRFAGRDLFFKLILAAQMFPMFLFLIPIYYLMKHWPLAGGNDLFGAGGSGLLNSYGALILPFAVNWWGIFMMRQFMVSLPDDLIDAARIDGCSEFRIYWQVILPLVKPALATLGIFIFMMSWNEYIWTAIITTSARHLMTVPVGIHLLRDAFDPLRNAAQMRAALAVGVTPVMILFLSLQRFYVKGIAMTGLKG